MNWGKITFVFFILMSLTTTAGFLYDQHAIALFIATAINLISTFMKVGIKNLLSAELFASSLVADLHLVPAFLAMVIPETPDTSLAMSLAIGAIVANIFSIALILIESSKLEDEHLY